MSLIVATSLLVGGTFGIYGKLEMLQERFELSRKNVLCCSGIRSEYTKPQRSRETRNYMPALPARGATVRGLLYPINLLHSSQ
jgi:hypothetical protein